jgi:hypothetical protein
MTNPYEPPRAPVTDPRPRAGSPAKAVLLGLAVDIGGTLLASMVLGAVYAVMLAGSGLDAAALQEAMDGFGRSGWGFAIGSAVGCGFSVLGGHVNARISRRTDYRLGWVQAALAVGLGVLIGADSYSPLQHVLLAGVSAACVLIGVRSGMRATAAR